MLERVPWLAEVPRDELKLVPRRFDEDRPLFLQGEPGRELFLIEKGSVRIARVSSQGREVTLAVRRAGDFIGDMAILDGRERSASAYAQGGPCHCQVLAAAQLKSVLEKHPKACLSLLSFMSLRLREASDQLEDMALRTVRERLAGALARTAARDGEPLASGEVLLPSWCSYGHLVGLLGTIRESASRATKELIAEGLVRKAGRRFVVRDLEGLWKVALTS